MRHASESQMSRACSKSDRKTKGNKSYTQAECTANFAPVVVFKQLVQRDVRLSGFTSTVFTDTPDLTVSESAE